MSEQLPNFLAVHFDGDFLEHAAFVETEEEWAQLTCRVIPGDHWDPVLIPIETAAAAPELLKACEEAIDLIKTLEYDGEPVRKNNYKTIETAIAKATG